MGTRSAVPARVSKRKARRRRRRCRRRPSVCARGAAKDLTRQGQQRRWRPRRLLWRRSFVGASAIETPAVVLRSPLVLVVLLLILGGCGRREKGKRGRHDEGNSVMGKARGEGEGGVQHIHGVVGIVRMYMFDGQFNTTYIANPERAKGNHTPESLARRSTAPETTV
jgi:hypothetical protein